MLSPQRQPLARARPAVSVRWPVVMCGLGLALAAMAVTLLLSPWRSNSYDVDVMAEVTKSMVTTGTFRVPVDGFNGPYSSYGLGMSLVFLPPYWLAEHLHRDPMRWLMGSNAFLFALTIVAVFRLTLGSGATRRQGVVTSLLVGFGTMLFPYAVTGYSEMGVALGIAIGLASLTMASRHPLGASGVAGAASGLTVLMRTDSLLLVVPMLAAGAWLLGGRMRLSALAAFAAAAAPWLYAVGAYNALRFGAPWHLGYAGVSPFNHPPLLGLYGLTLSPVAGLLWYAPLVAVAALGLRRALRNSPVLTAVALAIFLIRFPVYGAFWAWNGGMVWGPRYLVPAMPVLALGILEVVRGFPTLRTVTRMVVPAIVAVSVLVQLVGATVDTQYTQLRAAVTQVMVRVPGPQQIHFMTRPDVVAEFDRYSFDWRYFLITDEANSLLHGRNLMSRYLVRDQVEAADARGADPHKGAVAFFGALFAVGLGLALRGSRESRRRSPVSAWADFDPARPGSYLRS